MTMMKTTVLLGLCLFLSMTVGAQSFDEYFTDKTLRLDYILSGDATRQDIYLSVLSELPSWAGRRHHLAQLPLEGNGQLSLTDHETGTIIYRTSFSSLFLEWLETDEAQTTARGFEHTVLVPMPLKPVDVEVTLLNPAREVTARLLHTVAPDDILIHKKGTEHITPHRYLAQGGDPADCVDVAILAEGYTDDEMETFYQDAATACESLFNHEPFGSMRTNFNIVAVASPSTDSGVSIPRLGEWRSTAFSSHFSTFYSTRYLTTMHVFDVHDALAGIPYEHIIILANTDEYGGGGIYNDYTLTTAHHAAFRPVVVHEFGHSFGGLADEYFYEGDIATYNYVKGVETWEQNITTLEQFDTKWQDMLAPGTPVPTPASQHDAYPIGVYEGAGYSAKGVYRPAYDCRMKTNECPTFCPVCQRAIRRMIEFYTAAGD